MLGTLDAVRVSGYRAACGLLRILRRGDDVGIARPQPPPRHATKAPEGLFDGFSLELVWSSADAASSSPL